MKKRKYFNNCEPINIHKDGSITFKTELDSLDLHISKSYSDSINANISDNQEAVKEILDEINKYDSEFVLVIGYYDKRELLGTLHGVYGSNDFPGMNRSKWLASIISKKIGDRNFQVFTAEQSGVIVGLNLSESDLSLDRRADVYLIYSDTIIK